MIKSGFLYKNEIIFTNSKGFEVTIINPVKKFNKNKKK